jgi:hypothetical protein
LPFRFGEIFSFGGKPQTPGIILSLKPEKDVPRLQTMLRMAFFPYFENAVPDSALKYQCGSGFMLLTIVVTKQVILMEGFGIFRKFVNNIHHAIVVFTKFFRLRRLFRILLWIFSYKIRNVQQKIFRDNKNVENFPITKFHKK